MKQLLQASEFYALQLDESTDVAGLAHVRYVDGGSFKEDVLFCKKQERIFFKVLDSFVTSSGL